MVDDAAEAECLAGGGGAAVVKDEMGRDRIRADSSGRHEWEEGAGDIGFPVVLRDAARSLDGAAATDDSRHHGDAGGVDHCHTHVVSETIMMTTIVVVVGTDGEEVVLWR